MMLGCLHAASFNYDIKFIEVKTGKSKDVKKMQATLNEEGLLITDPTGEHSEPEKLLFPR
jgi:hypothetical protein